MIRRKAKSPYFTCETKHFTVSPECVHEKILEEMIETVLLQSIQKQIQLSKKTENLQQKREKSLHTSKLNMLKSMKQFEDSIITLKMAKSKHYESYYSNEIDKQEYDRLCEICNKEIDGLQVNINDFKIKIEDIDSLIRENKSTACDFQKCVGVTKLSKEIVEALVDKIIIYDAEHIEIVWKFKDMLVT